MTGHPALRRHPFAVYAAAAFGAAAALAAALAAAWQWHILVAWLAAITLVTFLMYGFDKAIARSTLTRVPERVLLALALAGGTVGALIAMPVFRHKTIKRAFRLRFWLVVAAQAALLAAYLVWLRR